MKLTLPCTILMLTLFVSATPEARSQDRGHPRLVDASSTACINCHEDLVRGHSNVHPPVSDDCGACHEVDVSEAGTQITLFDPDPALCVMCHDDFESLSAGEISTPHMPVTDACTNCHDPHASSNEKLLILPKSALCLDCHDLDELREPHGGQATAATDCTRCHVPHGSPNEKMLTAGNLHPPFEDGDCRACHRDPFGDRVRLNARGDRVCTSCHGDMSFEARTLSQIEALNEQSGGSLHGALLGRRSRAGCLNCHDPHMSENRRLLVKGGLELCATCHADVVEAAKAETGHFPASDDCTNCHQPHRSENAALLIEPLFDMCFLCHEAEDEELQAAHLGADVASLACTSCHTPHGAGNPKALAKTLHPPVLDGCDTCHEGDFSELIDNGESALCLFCHTEIEDLLAEVPVKHEALDLGACIECHNPHATPQRKLVKSPSGGACLECHFEIEPEEGEALHGIIDVVGCEACHEPHGGQQEKLLRDTGDTLCLRCHLPENVTPDEEAKTVELLDRFELPIDEAQRIPTLQLSADGRNHPVTGHRVSGTPTQRELDFTVTTFEGDLSCLACHNPHKGRHQLLLWDVSSTMASCLQCHPK